MRIFALLFVSVTFLFSQQSSQGSVSDLKWLSGLWGIVQGERTGEEYWTPLIKDRLEGKNMMKTKGKITQQEKMTIEKDSSGTIVYRVFTGGERPVTFKLVQSGPTSAVFENRKNVFPQRIVYEHISDDSLRATIEGTVKGKLQSVLFPFKRVIVNAD